MIGFPILPGGCAGPKALGRNKRELVVKLYDEKQHTVGQICEMMRISKPTLYKYVESARCQQFTP